MESTGWFVVAGILGLLELVALCFLDCCRSRLETLVVLTIAGVLFGSLLICIVMGFRAPDKMPVKVVVKEPSKEMVIEAAKKLLSEMSVQEKYKILEAVEKEGMED